MPNEFYGPTKESEKKINLLLRLPASGDEQDWEFELADLSKIDQMIEVFISENLDLEAKSALAVLLISSMQDADEAGVLREDQIRRAKLLLSENGDVLSRMRFYWIKLKIANNLKLLENITSGTIEK